MKDYYQNFSIRDIGVLWVFQKQMIIFSAFLLFPFLLLHAQNQKPLITGKVIDEITKETLPGVTIILKGTKIVTTTDNNGVFKLNVPAGSQQLIFKYIGYEAKEVSASGDKPITVLLSTSSNALQEVNVGVNVGYGTVSRERMAGAVSSIKAKDIADFPVSTAAEALAGKLAGVSVSSTEGAPGAEIKILVRGGTSVTQDNSPLYIVDGVPLDNALSIISPSEIASIDVLKDIASTSIYGSRGANGVVIITTKSGRKGRTIISFDSYAGVRKITNYLEMMKPYDYIKAQYEQNLMHYNGYLITDTAIVNGIQRRYGNYDDLEIYKSFPVVDWVKSVFGRSALSNTQILTMNGGSETSSYNFSVNRTSEDGIMLGSNLGRTFATFRFDNDISKSIKIGLNVRYSDQMVTGGGTSFKGANGGIQNAARFQPYQGVSNAQSFDDDATFDTRIDLSTPVTAATRDQRLNNNQDLITSGYLNINISPKFTFRSNLGYRTGKNINNFFKGVVNYEVSTFSNFGLYTDLPYVDLGKTNTVGITNSNTLSYRTTYGKDHKFEVLLGQEINKSDNDNYSQQIRFLPMAVSWKEAFANVQQANPPQGNIQASPVTTVSGERLLSFFGRAMYSYKGKYNLNISARRDGSSKFSEENRWSNFPSAQFAWRLSEEEFVKDLKLSWLSNFKLRASYGTAGNNRVGSDRLYTTLFATSPSSGGYAQNDNSQSTGIYSTHLANTKLKWETTISKNLGLDMDLFNSRFNLSVDVYSNKTKDLLLNTNIPQQVGYNQQYQNIGSTRNNGLEIQMNFQAVNSTNFSYEPSFNISFNRNKVLSLNQGGQETYGYAVSSGWGANEEDFYVAVGQPVGQYYGYISDGFYRLEDFDRTIYETTLASNGKQSWVLNPGVADASAKLAQAAVPGVMKLKDLDGDGVITNNDKTIIGRYQPKFFGGFNNRITYKSFDLSVFFNFSYGNKTYNANKIVFGSRYKVNGNNLLGEYSDSWTYFDQNGKFMTQWDEIAAANEGTKIHAPTNGPMLPYSDAIEDGSFIRITNLTLGYSLPSRLIERLKYISRFRVYATVNNLYTLTNYSGFDAEASTRSSALTPGVDYSAYPRNRYMLAGINVSF